MKTLVIVLLLVVSLPKHAQPLTVHNFGNHFEVTGEPKDVRRFLEAYQNTLKPVGKINLDLVNTNYILLPTPNDEYRAALLFTIYDYKSKYPIRSY